MNRNGFPYHSLNGVLILPAAPVATELVAEDDEDPTLLDPTVEVVSTVLGPTVDVNVDGASLGPPADVLGTLLGPTVEVLSVPLGSTVEVLGTSVAVAQPPMVTTA